MPAPFHGAPLRALALPRETLPEAEFDSPWWRQSTGADEKSASTGTVRAMLAAFRGNVGTFPAQVESGKRRAWRFFRQRRPATRHLPLRSRHQKREKPRERGFPGEP